MKHILVPTDFSENAYQALIYATRLFENNPCTIHILHSMEVQASRLTSRVDAGRSEQVLDDLYDAADRKCEEVKARLIEDTPGCGHTFDVISTAMSLTRALNRICAQREVDLVVMGTKGLTGAKEVIMGSNAVKVIKKIRKIPVLIIPPNTTFEPIKRIVFPTAFDRPYDPADLDELLFLAKLHDSEIKIIHIREDNSTNDNQRINLDSLMEMMADVTCDVEWLELGDSLTSTINRYVAEQNGDLLAIVYYKHNFIVQLFRESVVKKIGRSPATPYLVIPAS